MRILADIPNADMRWLDEHAVVSISISRMAWTEVLSKATKADVAAAKSSMLAFEIDADVAEHAAALRRERARLRSPDAIILATSQLRGRTLITRNTKDFAADMPGIRIPYTL